MSQDIRDFLLRVVPWPVGDGPGFVNIHWTRPDLQNPGGKLRWSGKPTRGVGDFLGNVQWGLNQPSIKDIYFCLSLQRRQGRSRKGYPTALRSQPDAISLKSIWLDLDVKEKGYASLIAALDDLAKFMTQYQLPAPSAFVGSGGGVHVYWISDRQLSPDEWAPYAQGLKTAALAYGLKCDAGCTIDSARVLRVPGTLNYKTNPPRPTRLLGTLGKDYHFSVDLAMLPKLAPAVATMSAGAPEPFDLSDFPPLGTLVESLAAGLEREVQPLDLAPLVRECPFVREALTTGGKDFDQPKWNLTTLLATFLEDGHTAAHAMGNRHPGYTVESTDDIWARKVRERKQHGLGWPGCAAIRDTGYSGCAMCPHLQKGKSPLNFTVHKAPPAPAPTPVTATVTAFNGGIALAVPPPNPADLPDGYAYDRDGYICKTVEIIEPGQAPVTEYIKLFYCKVFGAWAQNDPPALNFYCTVDMGRIVPVHIKNTEIANNNELFRVLMGQKCLIYPANKRHMEHFLVAWMAKLHAQQQAQNSQPFGWLGGPTKEAGFVYGGVVVNADGTMRPSGYSKGSDLWRPTGDLEPWYRACKMITDEKRPGLDTIIATAFAAPLMRFAGQANVLLSVWGLSASHKSTAMAVAMAVWSHPKKTKEVANSTPKSLLNKAGALKNLPLYWDDLKDEKAQNAAFEVLFAEGIEGSRLTSEIEQRERGDYQTIIAITANASFIDHVIKKHRTTDAGINRTFEYHLTKAAPGSPGLLDTVDASRITQDLEANYGGMGMLYTQLLATRIKEVDKRTTDAIRAFEKAAGGTDADRFWTAFCGTILVGAELANELNANLDLVGIREHLLTVFAEMTVRRKDANVQGGTLNNTESILTGFLKECSAHTLITDTAPNGPGKPRMVQIIAAPSLTNPRPGAIKVHIIIKDRQLRLERRSFDAFLKENDIPASSVLMGLKQYFNMKTAFLKMAAGTPFGIGAQEDVLVFPILPNSPLSPLLTMHEQRAPDGSMVYPEIRPAGSQPVLTTTAPAVEPTLPGGVFSGMIQAAADMDVVKNATGE